MQAPWWATDRARCCIICPPPGVWILTLGKRKEGAVAMAGGGCVRGGQCWEVMFRLWPYLAISSSEDNPHLFALASDPARIQKSYVHRHLLHQVSLHGSGLSVSSGCVLGAQAALCTLDSGSSACTFGRFYLMCYQGSQRPSEAGPAEGFPELCSQAIWIHQGFASARGGSVRPIS